MEGTVAAVLLVGGGLTALQAATIVTGLPFAVILLFMCFALYKTLKEDLVILERGQTRRKNEMLTDRVAGELKKRHLEENVEKSEP